ncbi:FRG domain-containing protein [Fenollaria massiliensis]|uniref:FRG domain-containing protein n=1 Tax=Fenollaria massiliensis TaxID=938288 RepID=A0A9E7DJP8_9FIRM|nr:FRG domain-containing protein [Fenollaria massiliensis]UQK59074.1 FRG domain-containing protein [Fenollaria massiliensis]
MTDNNKKSYAEIIDCYNEDKCFIKNTIVIKYIPNISEALSGNRNYNITSVNLVESNDEKNKAKIEELVTRCNNLITREKKISHWQVFYLYKELLQTLTGDGLNFNYFRGQSDKNDLLPGALRYSKNSDYIRDFEGLYLRLSYEFPDIINYVSMSESNIAERESNLSVLQHYGLKTALLDITKNPYIAMLFMLRENIDEYRSPTLYLFKINDQEFDSPTLFSEVRKSHTNERIIAQKGAFLNFEKVQKNKLLKAIPYVKIILEFDEYKYQEALYFEKGANLMRKYDLIESNEIGSDEDVNNIKESKDYYEKNINKIIELFNSVETTKKDCLEYINNELTQKLKEYYYLKEDMFPDFENRIRYLSNKYIYDDIQNIDYKKRKNKKR